MAMKRFLAATDGSRDGDHAVAIGHALAQRAGGEFARMVVEALPPAREPGLEWWREPVAPGGTTTRLRGLPGIEIVRHAESWNADLLVLGRHDHTPKRPAQLGPTSDTVIRRRGGASLFVSARTKAVNRVLVALDGSLRGLGVVGPASEFLALTGARAFAICVLPGADPDAGEGSAWEDPRSERARALMERLKPPSIPCDFIARRGDPVREILDLLESALADVLILGVRRGGAPGDLGSGHVGRDLLQAAPTAVLTVPI